MAAREIDADISYKWVAQFLAGAALLLGLAGLGWIKSSLDEVNAHLDTIQATIASNVTAIALLKDRADTQKVLEISDEERINATEESLAMVQREIDDPDWIAAQYLGNKSMREAKQALHPHK